jgi:hypothetical protein
MTEKLRKLLEQLGSAAAEPVATKEDKAIVLKVDLANSSIYSPNHHKQSEDLKPVLVEGLIGLDDYAPILEGLGFKANEFNFSYLTESESTEETVEISKDAQAHVEIEGDRLVIEIPTSEGIVDSDLGDKVLAETMKFLRSSLIKEEETVEVPVDAEAEVKIEDEKITIEIPLEKEPEAVSSEQLEVVQECVAIIGHVFKEGFNYSDILTNSEENKLSLVESFISMDEKNAFKFVDNLPDRSAILFESVVSEYSNLREGILDRIGNFFGRNVKDRWNKWQAQNKGIKAISNIKDQYGEKINLARGKAQQSFSSSVAQKLAMADEARRQAAIDAKTGAKTNYKTLKQKQEEAKKLFNTASSDPNYAKTLERIETLNNMKKHADPKKKKYLQRIENELSQKQALLKPYQDAKTQFDSATQEVNKAGGRGFGGWLTRTTGLDWFAPKEYKENIKTSQDTAEAGVKKGDPNLWNRKEKRAYTIDEIKARGANVVNKTVNPLLSQQKRAIDKKSKESAAEVVGIDVARKAKEDEVAEKEKQQRISRGAEKYSGKLFERKELEALFEALNLDTRKYTIEYLAEQLGFGQVGKASELARDYQTAKKTGSMSPAEEESRKIAMRMANRAVRSSETNPMPIPGPAPESTIAAQKTNQFNDTFGTPNSEDDDMG